jgi:glycosyltransferase involved in cell wall biosynthesis
MTVWAPVVTHLTSVHQLDDDRIFIKECRTLAAAGFDVSLIGPAQADGMMDGVRLRALPVPQGRLRRMSGTVWQVLVAALRSKASVCHFHDPELIPVGICLKLLGRRVVYDVHEDYPQKLLDKAWIPVWLRRPLAAAMAGIEKVAAWLFDGIVAVTPTIAARFPPAKTIRLANFPRLEEFSAVPPTSYRDRPLQVGYAGLLAEQRGLFDMVAAAGLVAGGAERGLQLAGTFDSASAEAASRAMPAWRRVDHLGWLDRAGIARMLSSVRAGLVLIHPVPCYVAGYPIKMFEYMAAGLPVIASDFPGFREILDDGRCGLLIPPQDPAALAKAIEWVFANPDEAEAMGARGRRRVEQLYTWQAESAKLVELYRRLAGPAEAPSCAY